MKAAVPFRRRKARLVSTPIAASLLLLAGVTPVHAQGSLARPAGPPAPTHKTLQQIELRLDLFNAPAGAVSTEDPDYRFVILQAGTYYLSANLLVGGLGPPVQPLPRIAGIRIDASNVTLDLMGFGILGSPLGNDGGHAITVSSNLASPSDPAPRASKKPGPKKRFPAMRLVKSGGEIFVRSRFRFSCAQ